MFKIGNRVTVIDPELSEAFYKKGASGEVVAVLGRVMDVRFDKGEYLKPKNGNTVWAVDKTQVVLEGTQDNLWGKIARFFQRL